MPTSKPILRRGTMNVMYSNEAKQQDDGAALMERATQVLEEEVLGPKASQVQAEWDRVEDDKGQPRYLLSLDDGTYKSQASLKPDELRSPWKLRFRLHGLWDDLLEAQSEALLKRIFQLLDEGE
jgi:hypothetical protein